MVIATTKADFTSVNILNITNNTTGPIPVSDLHSMYGNSNHKSYCTTYNLQTPSMKLKCDLLILDI